MAEDDIMHITLQKRDKGQTWSSPILGQGELDPYASDLEQKRLMLQRFQEEVNYTYSLIRHNNSGFMLLAKFTLLCFWGRLLCLYKRVNVISCLETECPLFVIKVLLFDYD